MIAPNNDTRHKKPLTPAWTPLRFHPVQFALWWSQSRIAVVPAGRGSGKTELSRRRIASKLIDEKPWSDPFYFYGMPTYRQAKRVAWKPILSLIPKSWIDSVSHSDLIVRTIFGSELHVVGLDQPQRIEGTQWDGCVIDESSDIKPSTFDMSILPALTHRNGWCWRTGVPKRFGIGAAEYREFYEAVVAGEVEDAAAFSWPSSDIVSQEQIRLARSIMDERDFDEQFNASFLNASGGIFHAFDESFNVRPCGYNPSLPILVGSDFNVDPMAWVIGHRYGNRIEVFDEIWIRNTNTQATLDTLYNRYQHHTGGFEFYGDASGQSRSTAAAVSDVTQIYNDTRFKKLGRSIMYLRSNPSIADKFAAANALICSGDGNRRLHIDPKCKRLIADLSSRAYKAGTRKVDDGKDQGHISDALCYIIYRLSPIVPIVDGGTEIRITGAR